MVNLGLEIFGIGLLIFWIIIFALRHKLSDRGFSVYPLLLMWRKSTRTKWFPQLANSKIFKNFEKLSVVLGIISMIAGIALIYYVIEGLLFHPSTTSARLEPIIPGITIGLNEVPYLLLAIGISVTLHELAHAVSATSNKIDVKSGGFILIGIFPGAFVEPEDDSFNSSSTSVKLKIIAAGIAVNIILAAIFFPLASYLPQYLSQGILVEKVIPNSSAYNASILPGDIILYINGIATHTFSQLQYALNSSTHYIIKIMTANHSIVYVNATSQSHFLGVYVTYYFQPFWLPFLEFFTWMFIVNFSLALFNAAPLVITDGGKIFTELLRKVSPKSGDRISFTIQSIILLSLIYAIILSVTLPQ
ncbi:S2P metalloprotease [Candidatus Acidianus copahuensis]|uniref:S2P metalloprotease n=1 Tax=Candidatus Acidianus copahuensis TaxID=1160895 RepID=A0A031LK19_9CREN|nr:site-2 protease family protein [Candidatus Acidianus copahuensis]EZQ03148.1 S2P metalloprotease [Candidatus Acidianus copahuensis]